MFVTNRCNAISAKVKQNHPPMSVKVCLSYYTIDLSRTCYRHVPNFLDLSIEVSQYKEYRSVIVSRCLVPVVTQVFNHYLFKTVPKVRSNYKFGLPIPRAMEFPNYVRTGQSCGDDQITQTLRTSINNTPCSYTNRQ